MEIDASSDSVIIIAAIAAGAALVVLLVVFALRTPPEYGAGEFARGPDNPTVTTIARHDLIAIRFFENQALVAKARLWGLGDTGIALSLKGDPTEYLLTNDGDWFEETRFRVKPDIRLMLLAGGTQMVTAERVPDTLGGWKKGKDGKYTRVYVIDCPQGRFDLVRVSSDKLALRRGDTVLGIAAKAVAGRNPLLSAGAADHGSHERFGHNISPVPPVYSNRRRNPSFWGRQTKSSIAFFRLDFRRQQSVTVTVR